MILAWLLISLGLLSMSFFAGFETGAYSVNRLRLRVWAEQGQRGALTLQRLLRDPQRLIVTMLVGNNLAVYLVDYVATTQAQQRVGEHHAELLVLLLLTPLVWLLGELLPKELFRARADKLATGLAWLARFFELLFLPAVLLCRAYTGLLERLVHGGEVPPREAFLTEQRMAFYLSAGAEGGVLTRYQDEMARKVIAMRQRTVRDVMVPLDRVEMVKNTSDGDALFELARRRRFSRYPVFRRRRTKVIGVLNLHEVIFSERPDGPIKACIRDVVEVSLDAELDDALLKMQAGDQAMAVVVRGRKAVGIVTVNDLVEEIVGDLEGL